MPQIQNTVLTDRQSTPVAHTFVPSDISQPGSVGVLVNTDGTLLNAKRLTISMRKSTTGKMKGRLTLAVPVVQDEVINGVSRPTTLRTSYASVDVSFDVSSSLQERKDLIGMLYSALDPSKVLINDALVKGESIY